MFGLFNKPKTFENLSIKYPDGSENKNITNSVLEGIPMLLIDNRDSKVTLTNSQGWSFDFDVEGNISLLDNSNTLIMTINLIERKQGLPEVIKYAELLNEGNTDELKNRLS